MKNTHLVLALFALLFVSHIEATHFRFGTIRWFAANTALPHRITFRVDGAWRRSFFGTPNVGSILSPGDFCFGDGKCSSIKINVTAINTKDDWAIGTWTITRDYPNVTSSYIAHHSNAARISTLVFNKDTNWRFETAVNINMTKPNQSPIVSGLPIVPIAYGVQNFQYTVPAIDPDGDDITFSLSTGVQMGDAKIVHPPTLSLSPTGVVTIDTRKMLINRLYNTQHIVTDSRGGYTSIDYLLYVIESTKQCDSSCSNGGTTCIDNGDCKNCDNTLTTTCLSSKPEFITTTTGTVSTTRPTPANGETFTVPTGKLLTIDFVGHDAVIKDATKIVTIYSGNIPVGSTMSTQRACAPSSALNPVCNTTNANSPQIRTLTWTPAAKDVGSYAICVGLSSSTGAELAYGQHCITITVTTPTCNSGVAQPKSGSTYTQCQTNFDPDQCQCSCPPNFDPATRCFDCLPGFFGDNCDPCPDCHSPQGICSDGILGEGTCTCVPGYTGLDCNTLVNSWCTPNAPSSILARTDSTAATVNPINAFVTMNVKGNTGRFNFNVSVNVPAKPMLDVVVLQDISSGTTASDITSLVNYASTFITTVAGFSSAPFFGVGYFDSNTNSYRRIGALTGDSDTFKQRLGQITPSGATATTSGASLDALAAASADSGFAWRTGSYKLIVVVTPKRYNTAAGFMTPQALKTALVANNAVPIFLSDEASYYATAQTALGFGVASATALTSSQSNWNTLAVNAIQTALQQVVLLASGDQYNFFTSGTSVINAAKGINIAQAVFTFQNDVPNSLVTLPTLSLVALGWGSSDITLVINRAPSVVATTASTNEDTSASFTLGASDPDNNLLEATYLTVPPASAGRLLNEDGTLISAGTVASLKGTFVPTEDWNGQTTFTYKVSDRCDSSATGTATINVMPINDAPVASSFALTTPEDTNLTIDFGTRVSDPDNTVAELKVIIISPPAASAGTLVQFGTATVVKSSNEATGKKLTFVPAANWNGQATFTYYAADLSGTVSTTATVTLNVTPVNDAPSVYVPRTSYTCKRGAATTIPFTITDPDGQDTLTFTMQSSTVTQIVSFQSKLNSGGLVNVGTTFPRALHSNFPNILVDGNVVYVTYTPSSNAPDGDAGAFTIFARDSALNSNSITVALSVTPNSPPYLSASNPSLTPAYNEDSSNNLITLTGTDDDAGQGANLTFTITKGPAHGTLKYRKTEQLISFTNGAVKLPVTERDAVDVFSTYGVLYTPTANYFGSDSFTFIFQDSLSGTSQEYTFKIQVNNVNDPPTSSDVTVYTSEDTPVTINQFVGQDVDGAAPTKLIITTLPAKGRLYLSDGVTAVVKDAVILAGNANNDGWKLVFVPTTNENGSPYATFNFKVNDDIVDSPIYSGIINVSPVNDPPTTEDKTYTLAEDTVLSFVLPGADVDNDVIELTVSILHIAADFQGTVYSDKDLTAVVASGSTFPLTTTFFYLPPTNAHSVPDDAVFAKFDFQVTDPSGSTSSGSNTASFIVTSVNDPPTINFALDRIMDEDTTEDFVLVGQDDDTPSSNIVLKVLQAPTKGRLVDKECPTCEEMEITPDNTNPDAPHKVDNENRILQFTPAANEFGTGEDYYYTTFVFSLIDSEGASSNYTMKIYVRPVNDAPVINPEFTRTVETYEDTPVVLIFNGTDIDSPATSLAGIVSTMPRRGNLYQCIEKENDGCEMGALINLEDGTSYGSVNTSSTVARWKVVFLPDLDGVGNNYATIGFSVSDDYNARSIPALVTIRVKAINDPPVVEVGGPFDILVGESLPLSNTSVSDPDAAQKELLLVLTVVGETGQISLSSSVAYENRTRKGVTAADCVQNNQTAITCRASQTILRSYLTSLTFTSDVVGEHTVSVYVNDLGHGAAVEDEATHQLSDEGSITIVTQSPSGIVKENKDVTIAIIGASVGGAAVAGLLVFAIRKFTKKTDDGYFDNMAGFSESNGIIDNPIYMSSMSGGDNPLFEANA